VCGAEKFQSRILEMEKNPRVSESSNLFTNNWCTILAKIKRVQRDVGGKLLEFEEASCTTFCGGTCL